MRIFVPIRLRSCTRCGHLECPCCQGSCDDIRCLDGDGAFGETMKCIYMEPLDENGYDSYAKLTLERPDLYIEYSVKGGLLLVSEDDIPTDEELETLR
jgi:hypothetical protein